MENKPFSMSVKDYLIKTMAVRTNTPSAIIEAIVNHQFEEATIAMKTSNSIEISGFCRFVFKMPAALRKLNKEYSKKAVFENLLRQEQTDQKRQSLINKLNNTLKGIEELETKIYGSAKNSGGMEEHHSPKGGIEGSDREGV